MGCTGSKPSHLLLTSNAAANGNASSTNGSGGMVASPHKGVILFNSKTLAYLRANEAEIRPLLVKRCALKASTIQVANKTSSSLLKSKKSVLPSSNQAAPIQAQNINDDTNLAAERAVSYVMNYALNEFDINSFSRSNHLNMKQIRKDITKKAATDTEFASTPYYKVALNTAIDEFGSYVKEQFIAINEFDAEKHQQQQQQQKEAEKVITPIEGDEKTSTSEVTTTTTSEEEAAEALKLKEALEVARQNFYKGKLSQVCLSKHGEGYVVKEMKEHHHHAPPKSLNTSASNTSDDLVPKINVEDVTCCDVSITNKDDAVSQTAISNGTSATAVAVAVNNANKSDMKSVSNISVKSVEATGTTSRTRLDEFVTLKESMDMMGVMRETLECIVRYSTRPNDESSVNDPRAEPAALIHNLARAASIIDAMRRLDEHDQMHCVDAKLVESVLNLDYVVDEFRSYLSLVRDEANKRPGVVMSEQYRKCLDDMDEAVDRVAKAIDETPAKLFTSKGLPPPREPNNPTLIASKTSKAIEHSPSKTPLTNGNGKHNNHYEKRVQLEQEEEEHTPIDIKKEIAFSILNVGEVLAKTIDYYSLPSKESDELKELIKISEAQAAHERMMSMKHNGHANHNQKPLQVSVEETTVKRTTTASGDDETTSTNNTAAAANAAVVISEAKAVNGTAAATSSSSALSSPTISTTSSAAASGSISPARNDAKTSPTEDRDAIKSSDENEINEQLEKFAARNGIYTKEEEKEDQQQQQQLEEQQSQSKVVTSSSSSDLIMTNSNSNNTNLKETMEGLEDVEDDEELMRERRNLNGELAAPANPNVLVHEFITNIIENASKRLSDVASDEVEIEIEREEKHVVFRSSNAGGGHHTNVVEAVLNGSVVNKRMSLDEELMYQLEDVDKKVRYMNETCSENEDDDDDEDDEDGYRNGDDSNLDRDLLDDDERLFQPARRPGELKRLSRQQQQQNNSRRQMELHEEIKQISTVIQDLVQTINQTPEKGGLLDSPVGTPSGDERKQSLNSSKTSSIPVLRQRVLLKQKASTVTAPSDESFKTSASSNMIESFVEFGHNNASFDLNSSSSSPTNGSARFKSKLPVKK